MSFFTDAITPKDQASIRAQIIGIAQAAGLKVSNWRIVSVAAQMLEVIIGAAFGYLSVVPTITRGFASLDTSSDPGDDDPFDPNNAALEPSIGFLSTYGQNTYGTTREEATFATGFATFHNGGNVTRTIAPFGLIYTWTANTPPSPAPTYTNTPDASVYTNTDGTLTVSVGQTVTIPVTCQILGAIGSAPSASLSLTTSLVGCDGTNADPVVGNNREDRLVYIGRCREAGARLSFNGPADAYAYFAAKNLDGTVLLNDAVPPAPTGITRVQVVGDSSTGVVTTYYASTSGPAIADDVTAANKNIQKNVLAVADAITFSGVAASTTSIHVVGTAKIKAKTGITAASVAAGIVAALTAEQFPIGGVDQVSGAGVIYTRDLEAIARSGFAGIYDLVVTTPAGLTTAIPVGHVPVINSVAGDGLGSADWFVTVVS